MLLLDHRSRTLGVVVACAALAAMPDPAMADEAAACRVAFEHTQELLRSGKLELARVQAIVCEKTCPENIAPTCTGWRYEAEARMPSVVVEASEADGRALVEAYVEIDGKRAADKLDGAAIPLEPGMHRVRCIRRDGVAKEQAVNLMAGEKRRTIRLVFPAESRAASPRAPASAGGGLPAASYVLGGVGLASVVAAAALTIHGHLRRSELGESCSPLCDDADVDPIRAEWLVAGILGGVGAASLGLAIVFAVTADGTAPARTGTSVLSIGASATTRGADAQARFVF